MHYIRIWSSRTGNVLHAFLCYIDRLEVCGWRVDKERFYKKGHRVTSVCFPVFKHRGIHYPTKFADLLSRTGNVLHASVNQLSHACLLQKRIFRFTPAIPGDCTVPRICSECLPGFPQISRAQFSLLSFLSSFSAVQ